ncbi:MAG: MATE family efflux transporter [Treponema sp.]|nr:MATE family efflux transporter [Treponema sp.]
MEQNIFSEMPVKKAYFKVALPVVMGMVVSLIYNLVDTWFIARTGDTALVAGVSLCAPIFSLLIALADICGLGGSTAISRLLGADKKDEAKHVSSFCIYGTFIFSVLVTVILLCFSSAILNLLGATEETFTFASSYYLWLALGSPFTMLNIVLGNLLRTEGLSTDAMFCTIIGAVVNIILDPIFIFVFKLGAAGAAMATVISNIISDILLMTAIIKKAKTLSCNIKESKINAEQLKGILFIGIPASITNLMQSFAVLLTDRCLVPYGTSQIASLGIAMKVNMICMLVMVGFAFGAQPLIGFNYGSGNKKRLNSIIKFDIQVEVVTAVIFIFATFIAAPHIISVFMSSKDIIDTGSLMLRCLMISSPAVGIILVCTTLFQAEGKAFPAFILSIGRQGIFLALCLAILPKLLGYNGIILSQAAADVVSLIVALVFLVKTRNI